MRISESMQIDASANCVLFRNSSIRILIQSILNNKWPLVSSLRRQQQRGMTVRNVVAKKTTKRNDSKGRIHDTIIDGNIMRSADILDFGKLSKSIDDV